MRTASATSAWPCCSLRCGAAQARPRRRELRVTQPAVEQRRLNGQQRLGDAAVGDGLVEAFGVSVLRLAEQTW